MNGEHTRRRFAAIAIAALGLAIAAPAAAQDTKLNIGVSVKSIFGLPLVVARDKGFFKEEGLDVTLEYFSGGPPATAALMGGSLQFLNGALENNVKTAKANQPIVTIMNIQSNYAGAIILRKEIADKLGRAPKVEDLKGLKIGTLSRGGFTDVSTRYILKTAGIDPEKDATLVPIRGADRQLAAGKAGEIDAAMVTEPWGPIAVEGLGEWVYVLNTTVGQGPVLFQDMGYVVLQTTRDYLAKNRPVAEKVVRAIVKAQKFIADPKNVEEVTQIALKEYGDSQPKAMRISVETQAKTYVPYMNEAMIGKTMDLLVPNGLIKEPAPAYKDVVDASFEPLWKAYGPVK
ncbi:ABC transporter substrate-binding protein [Xanthobacter tagetidis]|jgi:NitT/TauT family transport system substrate-binding protein|uniref:ABC transporter substrate-binding protein n=1 Tax=Xanthobacter tagetidis TaxID=60216 RepID=A0A3L7AQ98_9HYPH|nr:ABC transporter substrate-binding protein [Xanthobacter tagetidis]MBB6307991.1 NitT/TauT family transport system substrate-binding protein [Xanthobacter tagetidis]RLP81632.1 ABC transporter substrate-binding protein [Xanthobacter tagetidis]